jgi:hypothetical protein
VGGLHPYPISYGAQKHRTIETILRSLNEGDGTFPSKDEDSYVYAENWAVARAIADLWSTNRRLSYQWDAKRMTDMLPRWETIFALHPLSTDTEAERRASVGAKFAIIGKPATHQVVHDLMVDVLGDIYVQTVNTSSSDAFGYAPGGIAIPGGVTLDDGPWTSGVAYVAIELEQPTGVGDQAFFDTAGKVHTHLDSLLPAWVDFGWFKDGTGGTGFFLDDTYNLDVERFDS